MAKDKTYELKITSEGITYSVPLTDLPEETRKEIISSAIGTVSSLDAILQDSLGEDNDEDFRKEPEADESAHVSPYSHSPEMPYGLNKLEGTIKREFRETLKEHIAYGINKHNQESDTYSDLELAYLLEFTNNKGGDKKNDSLMALNGLVPAARRRKIYNRLREKGYKISISDRNRLAKFDGKLVQIYPSEESVRGRGHNVTLTPEGRHFVCSVVDGVVDFKERMDARLYVLDELLKQNNRESSTYCAPEERTRNLTNNVPFSEEEVKDILKDLRTNNYVREDGFALNKTGERLLETFRERLDYLIQTESVLEEEEKPETDLIVNRLRNKTYSEADIKELENLLKVDGISEEVTTAIKFITAYDGLPKEQREIMARPEMIAVYENHITVLNDSSLLQHRLGDHPLSEVQVAETKEEIRAIVEELIDVDAVKEMNAKQRSEYYAQQIYSDVRLLGITKKRVGAIIAHVANPASFNRD